MSRVTNHYFSNGGFHFCTYVSIETITVEKLLIANVFYLIKASSKTFILFILQKSYHPLENVKGGP